MKPYGYNARVANDFGEKLNSTKTGQTPSKNKKDSRRIDKKKNRARLAADLRKLAQEDLGLD